MKIYVGNILSSTTRRSLNRIFSVFGKVKSTKITPSVLQGSDGAFGMVEMPNNKEAKQAIGGLSGSRLDGLTINASEALISHVRISEKKGHKKTALIIDEDSNLARGLEDVLKEAGYNSIVTFIASDLREISETIKADLVIVNLRQPREMGFSIVANIKKAFPLLPIIGISAEAGIFGEEELKRYGVSAFAAQPFDAGQLKSIVHTLLQRG